MEETKEVKLPSGAVLKITPSPFSVSRALFQALLEELKALKLDPDAEVDVNLFKDIFCVGVSSKKIEACLAVCMRKVTYNDLKIDDMTFEPVEAREDYLAVCFEVTKENIQPFTKSLYAQFSQVKELMGKLPA